MQCHCWHQSSNKDSEKEYFVSSCVVTLGSSTFQNGMLQIKDNDTQASLPQEEALLWCNAAECWLLWPTMEATPAGEQSMSFSIHVHWGAYAFISKILISAINFYWREILWSRTMSWPSWRVFCPSCHHPSQQAFQNNRLHVRTLAPMGHQHALHACQHGVQNTLSHDWIHLFCCSGSQCSI